MLPIVNWAATNAAPATRKMRVVPSGAVAQERAPPAWGYGVGEKAVFLMRRMSAGSSFVKAKHLAPRSFSDAPMR